MELERYLSVLITNAMFFDLVDKGKCTIKELPILLPMALKGAVRGCRQNLISLGESHKDIKVKRYSFDYMKLKNSITFYCKRVLYNIKVVWCSPARGI